MPHTPNARPLTDSITDDLQDGPPPLTEEPVYTTRDAVAVIDTAYDFTSDSSGLNRWQLEDVLHRMNPPSRLYTELTEAEEEDYYAHLLQTGPIF